VLPFMVTHTPHAEKTFLVIVLLVTMNAINKEGQQPTISARQEVTFPYLLSIYPEP